MLALPIWAYLLYALNPPQCPENYTQEQIDGSRCIIGANIGGIPLLLISVPLVWFISVRVMNRLVGRRRMR